MPTIYHVGEEDSQAHEHYLGTLKEARDSFRRQAASGGEPTLIPYDAADLAGRQGAHINSLEREISRLKCLLEREGIDLPANF